MCDDVDVLLGWRAKTLEADAPKLFFGEFARHQWSGQFAQMDIVESVSLVLGILKHSVKERRKRGKRADLDRCAQRSCFFHLLLCILRLEKCRRSFTNGQ
jgi:hypothetical protein